MRLLDGRQGLGAGLDTPQEVAAVIVYVGQVELVRADRGRDVKHGADPVELADPAISDEFAAPSHVRNRSQLAAGLEDHTASTIAGPSATVRASSFSA
jgi:hypothetical protein